MQYNKFREKYTHRTQQQRKEINKMRYDYGTLAAKTRLRLYLRVVCCFSHLYEIALITSFLLSLWRISFGRPLSSVVSSSTNRTRSKCLSRLYHDSARNALQNFIIFKILLGLSVLLTHNNELQKIITHADTHLTILLFFFFFTLPVLFICCLFFSESVHINFSSIST